MREGQRSRLSQAQLQSQRKGLSIAALGIVAVDPLLQAFVLGCAVYIVVVLAAVTSDNPVGMEGAFGVMAAGLCLVTTMMLVRAGLSCVSILQCPGVPCLGNESPRDQDALTTPILDNAPIVPIAPTTPVPSPGSE